MTDKGTSFTLTLRNNIYPVVFVVRGGNGNFEDFVQTMVCEGGVEEKIREQVGNMDKCQNTLGFRVDQGIVQGIFVKEPLSWNTLDTYAHECYHAVYSCLEYLGLEGEEAGAYFMDYLIRFICKQHLSTQKQDEWEG